MTGLLELPTAEKDRGMMEPGQAVPCHGLCVSAEDKRSASPRMGEKTWKSESWIQLDSSETRQDETTTALGHP